TLKSTAELVLMSHQEDPVLATWRYGLGRSAAFTSDAKAKWGVLWLRWRDFNKFWSQLVRWTLRSGSRSDTVAVVDRRDDVGELTGGAALEKPRDAFLNARRRSRIAVEIWPWLVGLVAALLIPEVALRRLGPGVIAPFAALARRRVGRKEAP